MTTGWPKAELNPVQRLRVMAAATNAVMYAEQYLDVPVTELWQVAGDLEGELPHLVPTLRAFTMVPGRRDRAWATGHLGHRAHFEVLLQPGWCLMQSRHVIGAMAAVPEGPGTRFAVLGGLRGTRLPRLLTPLRGLGRTRALRMISRAHTRTLMRTR